MKTNVHNKSAKSFRKDPEKIRKFTYEKENQVKTIETEF
jgi:hypothetical protein